MVSVSQVAQAADVSVATASRVLRNPDNARTAGQKRVLAAASRLGYNPSFMSGRSTRQILFLSFENVLSATSFFSTACNLVVDGVNRVIAPHGYNLLVSAVGLDEVPPPSLLRKEIDGVIFHGKVSKEFREKYFQDIPVIGVQYTDLDIDCSCVKIDNRAISALAVRHLAAHGHKRIVFLSDESESLHTRERLAGFREAMSDCGLPLDPAWECCWQRELVNGVLPPFSAAEGFAERLIPLFSGKDRPTALIGVDFYRAMIAVQILQDKLQLQMPRDISIIGSSSHIPLPADVSWISDRFDDVCSEAAKLLLELINGDGFAPKTIALRPELIPGKTVLNLR